VLVGTEVQRSLLLGSCILYPLSGLVVSATDERRETKQKPDRNSEGPGKADQLVKRNPPCLAEISTSADISRLWQDNSCTVAQRSTLTRNQLLWSPA
jgi:hypothetical protein